MSAPVPSRPLFLAAGGFAKGTQTIPHPCGCWEKTKQGYTIAYGQCEPHGGVLSLGDPVVESEKKTRRGSRGGRRGGRRAKRARKRKS